MAQLMELPKDINKMNDCTLKIFGKRQFNRIKTLIKRTRIQNRRSYNKKEVQLEIKLPKIRMKQTS